MLISMFLPQGINLEKQLPLCVVAKPTVRAGHLPGISIVLGRQRVSGNTKAVVFLFSTCILQMCKMKILASLPVTFQET